MDELKKYGVVFGEANGSIIGAAGLLLGLGKIRKMDGACLMGKPTEVMLTSSQQKAS